MDPISVIVGCSTIFCGLLCIGLAIPLLKGKVKMNRFYGVRFAKSFESDENWHKINDYGARRLIFWSIPMLAIGAATFVISLGNRPLLTLLLALAPILVLIPAVESYLYARKL